MRPLADSEGKDRRESGFVLYKVADPTKHFGRLGEQLCKARERGNRTLCDLEVRVGEENEFIHSLVGSVHSNFIRDVVNEKLKPPFVIDLSGLCASSVFKIMDWMYRGEVELPWKQIGDHLMVTGRLEIPVLHCQLEGQLRQLAAKNEHRANCINIATDSRYFVSSATKTAIIALATKEIGNFATSDLDKLSTNSINEMVGSADVSFSEKLDTLNSMLHWLRRNRYHLLDDVLPHIRVPCLQHEESAFVSHLRRLILNSDANERKNLHVYSDDGKRLIVSLDPKKFVKNSGVVVQKVSGDDQNEEMSSTEVENSNSCTEVYKVLGRYDFDASDLKELQNLPGFGKEDSMKQKKLSSKPNAFRVESKQQQTRPKTMTNKKNSSDRSIVATTARSPSVNAYEDKAEKSAKTVGRFDLSEKEVQDINRHPSIAAYSDARLIRGHRSYNPDEVRDMQRVPDCFVNNDAVKDCSIPVEVHERTSQTINRNALSPKEIEDLKRLPPIDAYADSRVIRGHRGFTQDEICEVKQMPDCFAEGSIVASTIGPSSRTFTSFKNYPSFCDPNYGRFGLQFDEIHAPSDASTYISTAGEPTIGEKSTKTIGRFDLNAKELEELRGVPSINTYADARVIRGRRGFTQDEICDLNRLPNYFDDNYTRHWVENGGNKQYSASQYYTNRPESLVGSTIGPFSDTYASYRNYPSFTGSDYNPNGIGFNSFRVPGGATIQKGLYGSQTIDDISRCPSICSDPYGRVVPIDRSRASLKDVRMIPDQFNRCVSPFGSVNDSNIQRYSTPRSNRRHHYTTRYRTPSEDSLATSADLRDLPDMFARASAAAHNMNGMRPIPTPQQSHNSDYWKHPRNPSVASTQLVYPDFDSSLSTVNSKKDLRTQGKFLASKSEIEDIARLPAIADLNPAVSREMPPSELSNLRRPLSIDRSKKVKQKSNDKSTYSNYVASGFGKAKSNPANSSKNENSKKGKLNEKEKTKTSQKKEEVKTSSVYLKPSNESKKEDSTYMFLK